MFVVMTMKQHSFNFSLSNWSVIYETRSTIRVVPRPYTFTLAPPTPIAEDNF